VHTSHERELAGILLALLGQLTWLCNLELQGQKLNHSMSVTGLLATECMCREKRQDIKPEASL
jgi:hypothetical protein